MDFSSLKEIVDFIKAIQAIEYIMKKTKDFNKWSKNNIEILNYWFYNSIVKWTIALLFILFFVSNTAYCIVCFALSIYKDNLTANTVILKVILIPILLSIIALYLLKLFFDYEKDRISYLRKKHNIFIT